MSEKVREFNRVIQVVYDVDVGGKGHKSEWIANGHSTLHLIEKSAYDRLAEINKMLTEALEWLVIDVQDYETWQRPCAAVTNAQAALAKAKEMGK